MENIKLEVDKIYAEKTTCILEQDDTQCGHIFYNENSRLLKFYCTFCQETYDNVEYYCLHLSEHLNDDTVVINEYLEQEEVFKEEKDLHLLQEYDDNGKEGVAQFDQDEKGEYSQDVFEDEQPLEEILNDKYDMPMEDFDNSEVLIEEIEDTDEIFGGVDKEINQNITERTMIFISDNKSMATDLSNSNAEINYTPLADNIKMSNSFEECFIKETNIDKIRTEGVRVLQEKKENNRNKPMQRRKSNIQDLLRLKRRRKKITTVKVIAVKNRIAELYERIKREQQKSQQILSNEFLTIQQEQQETQDAIESLISPNIENNSENVVKYPIEECNSVRNSPSDITRKVVGETLITLIPEGTKIPNKLPSPIKNSLKNSTITNACELPLKNSDYITSNKGSNSTEKKAVCPACGKTFRSHFSLTIHKRIHYLESDSSVKLAHKCPDCDQLFNKLSQLKVHVETVHYPEGFICKICNRQLSSMSLLERHMVKVHLGRPFNCKKCNKNFSDPVTYEEHLTSHISEEVFKCTTCGRKYSTEFFLLEHMRNHKLQIPQTCVVCGKVTLRITQHMKTHTPRPKRILTCSVCGKVFNFSSGLSHHFKIMHKLPRPLPKPKMETNLQNNKRKRRPRNLIGTSNKKKSLDATNTTSIRETSSFVMENDKFSDQIIEERIEVSPKIYENTSSILNLQAKENLMNIQKSNKKYINLEQLHTRKLSSEQDSYGPHEKDIINHKEEEAKRVIVELIQNSTYTSFFPDNFSSILEVAPPIAREETISAVNSIVHVC